MRRLSHQSLLHVGTALIAAALLALRAEAAALDGSEAFFAAPLALWHFVQGALIFFVLPALVLGAIAHRPLARALRPRLPQIEAAIDEAIDEAPARFHARLIALIVRHRPARFRAAPEGAPQAGPFHRSAPPAPTIADFAQELKARMALIHRDLRAVAPELLPPLAEYLALQNRLLAEAGRDGAATAAALRHLEPGLDRLEIETGKLSVVLRDATKEYALGSYADTLERLSGEAMDCLCGIRAAGKSAA